MDFLQRQWRDCAFDFFRQHCPLTFSVGIGSTSSGDKSGSTVIFTSNVAGTLPTDRGLEHTTRMFDIYWECLDDVDKYKADHDLLLRRKRILTTGIAQTKKSYQNGALEKVNQELRNLELDYGKKVEFLRKLPGIMASEDILAVKSLRDIQMVRNLQVVCRWKGKVNKLHLAFPPADDLQIPDQREVFRHLKSKGHTLR